MSRTNETRALVQSILSRESFTDKHGIKRISYGIADDEEMFPHIVFVVDSIGIGDLHRKDMMITIDIYDKSNSSNLVEDIADDVEDMFNSKNLPQEVILPTFYLENRRSIIDEDKKIKHEQVEIVAQNYER